MAERIKVEVNHLTKRFGDLLVLDDVSFQIHNGEFLCVVGPTGCGKTTFLNCLVKIYDITSGEICIEGENVDPRKHNLAYVFQEPCTMPWLTVEENVAFGLKLKRLTADQIKTRVDWVLEMVGLQEYRNYYPRQLSTSMLQRVTIAGAFAVKPDLLLMDEPYGQLDLELRFKLEDELLRLARETQTTVVFITHNIEEAVYLGDRILVLSNKPTTIKKEIQVNMPHPRDVTSPEFVAIRDEVTELIKWW